MQRTKPPFRADMVGSLLRTAALKDAEHRGRTIASVIGLAICWLGLVWLRRYHGRGRAITEPSYRERAIAALLDGVGMVALPVLGVLLAVSWLPSVEASPEAMRPALTTLLNVAYNAIFFLVVYGLSEASLTPRRPTWHSETASRRPRGRERRSYRSRSACPCSRSGARACESRRSETAIRPRDTPAM